MVKMGTAKIEIDSRSALVSILRLTGDEFRRLGDEAHARADAIEAELADQARLVTEAFSKAIASKVIG